MYYVDETKKVTKGEYKLVTGEYAVVPVPDVRGYKNMFKIIYGTKEAFLSADSKEERERWVRAITWHSVTVIHKCVKVREQKGRRSQKVRARKYIHAYVH